jgi:hypothetical protein
MAHGIVAVLSTVFLSLSLTSQMTAQGTLKDRVGAFLPSDAKIVETANLNIRGGKARVLVLWMSNPKRVEVPWDSGPDLLYGDHWFGPTSLSLIDPINRELINTIRIHSPTEEPQDNGSYSVPFFAWDGPYYVPRPDKNHKGTPLLLHLRDLTGEGTAGQFALFDYVASGISYGHVYGYSTTSDHAVQYPIEVTKGRFRPVIQSAAMQVFETKPVNPGYWKFTWEAGHGSFAWIDETVRFDPARQLFAERRIIRPYPGFAQTHCDLGIESVSDLLAAVGRVVTDFGDVTTRDVRGLIDTTGPDSLAATGVVVTFQGEQVSLQIEWLKSDRRGIGIEFTASSNLVAAIQVQNKAWCAAE